MSRRHSGARVLIVAGVLVVPPVLWALSQESPSRLAAKAPISELWIQPSNIAQRDLFHGAGGPKQVPPADGEFTVTGYDDTGYSAGYDVRDESGREWDVKLGNEAQSEVVASRVLWAIGYHQPVVHFLPRWNKKGGGRGEGASARFRLQSDHKTDGEWAWRDNPFVGTRELKGLLVANLVLNNWDLKDNNNRIYRPERHGKGPRRWFVMQDVGASLGRSAWPVGNRNDIDSFEAQNLIERIEDGHVTFDYRGRHRDLLEGITVADVAWACGLLNRLTDKQWADAFRAATVAPEIAERYIAKIKSKVAEGRDPRATRGSRR
jgi:hypothetical protein